MEVEVDVLGLERRFLPLGGFSGAGLVFFFHLGRRRALIHEKTRPRITLYEQGLIFVRVFLANHILTSCSSGPPLAYMRLFSCPARGGCGMADGLGDVLFQLEQLLASSSGSRVEVASGRALELCLECRRSRKCGCYRD